MLYEVITLYKDPQPYQYPDPAPQWARLILAYKDVNQRIALDQEEQRFPSRQLIPPALWPQNSAHNFVAEPLYFQDNQIGFALFEVGFRKGDIYEALRIVITSYSIHYTKLYEMVWAKSA